MAGSLAGQPGGVDPAGLEPQGIRRQPSHLVVGHLSKAHGTRGEVFVWPLTDRPAEVFVAGAELLLGDEAGRLGEEAEVLVVERVRAFKRGFLVKFAGLDDRTEVRLFGRRYLLLPLELVAERAAGEVFYHELLGLEVVSSDGGVVGRIGEVYETEPADLLEVEAPGGKLVLIPYSARVVEQVDLDRGRVVVRLPEGLLDL